MLTCERLKELLNYDTESGIFTWKKSNANSIKVGDVAGSVDGKGYLRIQVDKKLYFSHRLAWLYMTGEFPPNQIDHINGIKTDNRFANLRPATNQQNMQNSPKQRNNTSGFKGVFFNKQRGKWQAQINIPLLGQRHLGYFDTPEAAAAVYAGAAKLFHADYCHVDTVIIINNYFQGESAS